MVGQDYHHHRRPPGTQVYHGGAMEIPGMTPFSREAMEHLTGEKFSGFYRVRVSHREREIPLRGDLLEALLQGKQVVHLGFADHLPYIKKKVEEDTWLHGRLLHCAGRCLGIDVDQEAVAFVKGELGIGDVLCADVAAAPVSEIAEGSWDYMLLGEILEHVDDPVRFLARINEFYGRSIERVALTVPNAFWLKNFQGATKHTERLNTDHRYWFSAFTLGKVVVRAGMVPEGFRYCERRAVRTLRKRFLLRRFPALRETLVMVARTRA